MKWYKRYPADFGVDTGHLTLAEVGAYDRLLDHYYTQEEPLPDEPSELYRIARAVSTRERRAVDSIVDRFFPANGDGRRHNKRADAEIEKANRISEQRRIAGAKGGASGKH